MVDCSSLQKLDVSGNKLGLVGVEQLLQTVDICHLSSVNLSGTVGPGHAHNLLKQLAKLLLESVRILQHFLFLQFLKFFGCLLPVMSNTKLLFIEYCQEGRLSKLFSAELYTTVLKGVLWLAGLRLVWGFVCFSLGLF